jgi:N-acetyl-anhydromuramyl-L-alanine amidase AmpD
MGRFIALSPEEHRAWHAGASSLGRRGDVNARSIGIEIVNGGHDFDLPEFPAAQIEAVIALLGEILRSLAAQASGLSRIPISRRIAKLDPGEKFPWQSLRRGRRFDLASRLSEAPPRDPRNMFAMCSNNSRDRLWRARNGFDGRRDQGGVDRVSTPLSP